MISSAIDILNEVKKRADASNHVVQLFAIGLFKEEVFKKTHFISSGYYVDLHRERHRIVKNMNSPWVDLEDINILQKSKEFLDNKINKLKIDRQQERDSFINNYLKST